MPRSLILFAALAVALPPAAVFAQDPPPGALSCSGCHGAEAPLSLARLDAGGIAAALTAFADGSRSGTLMPRIAKGFTAEEIAAIAAWVAEQGDE